MPAKDFIKKPHQKTEYTEEQLLELIKCQEDPFYFIETYMKVQTMGKTVPLVLYDFQKKLVGAFHNYNKVIALTARQMGKCLVSSTKITLNGEKINIKKVMNMNTFRLNLIDWLERLKIFLARRQ